MEIKETGSRKKLQKNYLILISISITFFAIGILFLLSNPSPSKKTIKHENSGAIINIDIADDPTEHYTGLMNRILAENEGMLFIFVDSEFRTFWMKDTPESLDIIFLNQDMEIINFFTSTLPNQTLERYSSLKPSKFVLEVKSGFIVKYGLKANDKFILN